MPIGVDLHLHAAIGIDAFGDHGDHIDAVDLAGDDEGRRLVIGIGGARPDGRDERRRRIDDVAVGVKGPGGDIQSSGGADRRGAVFVLDFMATLPFRPEWPVPQIVQEGEDGVGGREDRNPPFGPAPSR